MATTPLLLTTFLSALVQYTRRTLEERAEQFAGDVEGGSVWRIILKFILLIRSGEPSYLLHARRCEMWVSALPATSLQTQISEDTWGTECSRPASCVSSGVISSTHPMQKLYYRLGSGDFSCLEGKCLTERYLELINCIYLPREDSRFVLNAGNSRTTQCFNN